MILMLALYILIGIVCFVAVCFLFNRYYIIFLPKKREELYIVVDGDIKNIEALLRELYSFLKHKAWFEPVLVDNCCGDSKIILQKFCDSYALPKTDHLPKNYVKTVYLNRYKNISSLKRELSLLRTEIEIRNKKQHNNA